MRARDARPRIRRGGRAESPTPSRLASSSSLAPPRPAARPDTAALRRHLGDGLAPQERPRGDRHPSLAAVTLACLAIAGGCRPSENATTTTTPVPDPVEHVAEPEPEGPPQMPPHAVLDESFQSAREAAQRRLLSGSAELQPELGPLPEGPLPGSSLAPEPLPGFFAPMELPGEGTEAEHNALATFEAALDGLDSGERRTPARLVMYGASGTAVDLWTGYLRTYLQERFGDGGPGMISAAPPTRWYRHHEFEVTASKKHWTKHNSFRLESEEDPGHFGVMGLAMSAKSKRAWAEIRPQPGSTSARAVKFYDVFFLTQPRGGSFSIKVDGELVTKVSTKLPRGEEAPRLGVHRVEVEPGEHRLRLELKGDGTVRFLGVSAETGEPGVIVDTLGVDGARISNWRSWDDGLWSEHLRQREPVLYALHFGTNSAVDTDLSIPRYEETYRGVLDRLRAAAPDASCVILGPGDFPMVKEPEVAEDPEAAKKSAKGKKSAKSNKSKKSKKSDKASEEEEAAPVELIPRPLLSEIREIQRRLAPEYGCAYWDMLKFDGGHGAKAAWAEAGLARADYLHLTRGGYLRWGIGFADALMQRYDWRKSQAPLEPEMPAELAEGPEGGASATALAPAEAPSATGTPEG